MRRAPRFAAASRLGLAVALALTTTGCGGGGGGASGGGGGGGVAAVARVFPPQDGLSDDATIVVRGTASSPDGIAGVTVAGVAATSNDGFGPIFDSPLGIATDGAHAWVANGGPAGVLRVDLATGLRTTVSNPLTGGGPAFTTVNGLAVDLVRGVAYVGAVDTTNDYGVFSVDLVTGDRAPVATAGFGSGPAVYAARTLRLASNGHVLSMGFRTLMDVDPDTDVRTAVSNAFVDHGPLFSPDASEVAGERSDGLVVIVDEGTAAVVVVDPVTGERLIVAR